MTMAMQYPVLNGVVPNGVPEIIDGCVEVLNRLVPVACSFSCMHEASPDVPPGEIEVRVRTHGGPPRSALPHSAAIAWKQGERDASVTRALYAAGYIEPHVTWASDLGWRVTSEGKKAGLK